jgi:hypothetical protein
MKLFAGWSSLRGPVEKLFSFFFHKTVKHWLLCSLEVSARDVLTLNDVVNVDIGAATEQSPCG